MFFKFGKTRTNVCMLALFCSTIFDINEISSQECMASQKHFSIFCSPILPLAQFEMTFNVTCNNNLILSLLLFINIIV